MTTPALCATEHDNEALLHLVVTSICIAVERGASAEADGEDVSPGTSVLAAALLRVYNEEMWKQPIEHELKVLNDWSLAGSTGQSAKFYQDIPYPVIDASASSLVVQQTSASRGAKAMKQPQLKRRGLATASGRRVAPALFQLSRIVEDPLEARWDHRGDPVPLRRNVLGEAYAPRSDPLQFVKQSREIPAAHIFQQVKRAVHTEAADREKRRIQALNDREALRKQKLVSAAQSGSSEHALSPEEALEAKFDRLLLDSGNNAPQRRAVVRGGGRNKGDDTDGEHELSDGEGEDEAEDNNQDYEIVV